jgi:hypothetical protein
MKIHVKKKAYRLMVKQTAKAGFINDTSGRFIQRSQAVDNSMKRDYSPQQGKR